MGEEVKKQIQQELEQYRLEVQNNELTTQITVAKETIIAQNQHIADLYSGMASVVTILAIVVAIVGIAIPIWYANKTKEAKKELEEIKNNVDDFITNKFIEWENQNIDEVLDKYLNNEIDWWHLQTVLKWKPMSFNHMKKVFDFAKAKGDVSPLDFGKAINDLAYYLFSSQKDNKNEDFNKARKLISNCKYLYTMVYNNFLIYSKSKAYIKILNTLTKKEQQDKILDLLKHSDDFSLVYTVNVIIEGNFLSSKVEALIVKKILQRKDYQSIKAVADNKNIVDLLKKQNLFDKATIQPAHQSHPNESQISLWKTAFNINKDSYLAKELKEYQKEKDDSI